MDILVFAMYILQIYKYLQLCTIQRYTQTKLTQWDGIPFSVGNPTWTCCLLYLLLWLMLAMLVFSLGVFYQVSAADKTLLENACSSIDANLYLKALPSANKQYTCQWEDKDTADGSRSLEEPHAKKMYVMKVLPQKAEARTQTLMSAAVTKRHFIPALNMLWRHFSKGYKGTFYSSNAGKFRKMQNLI